MLFLGIFFASFIFLFGFMMTPSINRYLDHMEKSIHAHYQYNFKGIHWKLKMRKRQQ